MPNYTAGQGIEITTNPDTISSKTTSSSQLGSFKVDGDSLYLDNNKVLHKKKRQTITLSDTSITVSGSDTVTASTNGDGTLSVQSSDTDVVTASINDGVITLNAVSDGNAIVTVIASGTSTWASGSANINVTAEAVHIYGAEWDGSSDPSWTRTDGAVGFEDPNPYYAGMSGSPSSPFDNISPWKDMRIVEDSTAGTLVEIPKFYYKLDSFGTGGISIKISMDQEEGFSCSPAHMDRGIGFGELDYAYIGRYHCASNYKSKSGEMPISNITRNMSRTSIRNLLSFQCDYAMKFTIFLLYLVEYANWNSQAKIGYGCAVSNSTKMTMGYTDSMPYHTGTNQTSRTTYGGTQYRYIEGLWDNVFDWVDGCYCNSNGLNIIMSPYNFSDSSDGTSVGIPTSGYPSKFIVKNVNGVFPMFIPSESKGNDSTYTCDYYGNSSSCPYTGGEYHQDQVCGIYYMGSAGIGDSYTYIGARLMRLPTNRISPP